MILKTDLDTLKAARDILLRVGTHGHNLLEKTIESLEDANRDELAGADPETHLLFTIDRVAALFGTRTPDEIDVREIRADFLAEAIRNVLAARDHCPRHAAKEGA